ncbi:MAG: hypothetical protein ACM3OO_01295 [Planctomycetaceae bacterium]
MPTVDEQLEALLRDAAPRPTTTGLDERLARRRRVRSLRKRIGNAVLIVAVFAGTIAGFLALSRAFDRRSIPVGEPSATASVSASVEPDVTGARAGDMNCEPLNMTGDVDGNHILDVVCSRPPTRVGANTTSSSRSGTVRAVSKPRWRAVTPVCSSL